MARHSNRLTQVPLSGLPALERLGLADNRIRNIGFLVHHARLGDVVLYGNPLNRSVMHRVHPGSSGPEV